MIYVTGDCHGDFRKFGRKHKQIDFHDDDYCIVCGDFGLCWTKGREFDFNCHNFAQRRVTILWVQGNHENYDMIAEYPLEEWHGGLVRHIVRDKVILMERGQIFDIDGVSIFAFGGASSHDISDGILDRDDYANELDYINARMVFRKTKYYWREKGVDWWEQELPTGEEIMQAKVNLENHDNHVDYVITHCCSTKLEHLFNQFSPNRLTNFFSYVDLFVSYKHWYFGHYHRDETVDAKHTVLYNDIIPLGEVIY